MTRANPTDGEFQALRVPCHQCGEQKNFWCRTVAGVFAVKIHSFRYRAAVVVGPLLPTPTDVARRVMDDPEGTILL